MGAVSKHSEIQGRFKETRHDNVKRGLIEAFQSGYNRRTGTIPARECSEILTEIGDDPVEMIPGAWS